MLSSGFRLGAFEILGPLGAGGMGEVYRARDTRLGREVALKVLPADVVSDADRLARFEREARTVASLNHPNIVTVHSVEDVEGTRFLTMELVEGQSLDRRIESGGLPIAQVLELGIALAEALAAAHEKGVVHRDLKPANVMLTRDGRVKVLDFGLAKLEAPHPDLDPTQAATLGASISSAGAIVGTVPYMSPEQLKGQTVDARSDIYSLGVVLYELAAGKRPFSGANSAETISAILRDAPRPVTESRHDAPRHLERIIDLCLEKDPEARLQTAKDVRNELRGLRRELDSGQIERSGALLRPRASRLRRWLVGGAAIVVVAVAAPWLIRRGPVERDTGSAGTTSLAVLPFTNMSSDREQEYFSDGLTEELLNVLAKVPDLKVAGRTSSFSFKGKNEDLRTIGRKLGVANILEGSVRKSGDRIRITAQLVKAEDGFHLWSETYERTLEDVFAVQDDIARQVAAALEVKLLDRGGETPGPAAAAYDLVLQARFALQDRTAAGIARGKTLLERALQLSPGYAPAWAEMGLAHTREGEIAATVAARLQARDRSRQALTRALELDPRLAVAHSRIAGIHASSWDFAAAESSAARALAADPRHPIVMVNAASLYLHLGRVNEAIALYERAIQADPLFIGAQINLATAHLVAGRLDRAEAVTRRVITLAADQPPAHMTLGDIHLARGEVEAARREYARFTELSNLGDHVRLMFEAIVEHTAGHVSRSRAATTEFERRFGATDPSTAAQIRAWRGDADAAFAWLDRALAVRDPYLGHIKGDFYVKSLRADPRWNVLMRKIGLPPD